MRRIVVLLTLVLSFVAPLALPAAQAREPGSVRAQASDTSCRRRHRKKRHTESKTKKNKKKDKKPYGFEL